MDGGGRRSRQTAGSEASNDCCSARMHEVQKAAQNEEADEP